MASPNMVTGSRSVGLQPPGRCDGLRGQVEQLAGTQAAAIGVDPHLMVELAGGVVLLLSAGEYVGADRGSAAVRPA